MENKMDVKETIVKVFNGLNDVEVKGANNVMLMGQIIFDLGNLIQQLEQEDQEAENDGEDK